MHLNWLQSIVYGLISGFAEFLPVSAEAHRELFYTLTDSRRGSEPLLLVCHVSILLALLLRCQPRLRKLHRERKAAAVPARSRKRQPDRQSLLEIRVLKTAAVPILLSFLAYSSSAALTDSLWLPALLLAINGVALYIPRIRPQGNKDSQSLSALDSFLIGLGGALAVLPGISRVGGTATAGQLRGTDPPYSLNLGLLLCIPALFVLIGFDLYGLIGSAAVLSSGLICNCILAAAAAFLGAWFGIALMRFLSVKIGFSGFSYYCWGAALFLFILYLTI